MVSSRIAKDHSRILLPYGMYCTVYHLNDHVLSWVVPLYAVSTPVIAYPSPQ